MDIDIKLLQQNLDEIRKQIKILREELSQETQYVLELPSGEEIVAYEHEVEKCRR